MRLVLVLGELIEDPVGVRFGTPIFVGQPKESADKFVLAHRAIHLFGELETKAAEPANLSVGQAIAVRRVAGISDVFELIRKFEFVSRF